MDDRNTNEDDDGHASSTVVVEDPTSFPTFASLRQFGLRRLRHRLRPAWNVHLTVAEVYAHDTVPKKTVKEVISLMKSKAAILAQTRQLPHKVSKDLTSLHEYLTNIKQQDNVVYHNDDNNDTVPSEQFFNNVNVQADYIQKVMLTLPDHNQGKVLPCEYSVQMIQIKPCPQSFIFPVGTESKQQFQRKMTPLNETLPGPPEQIISNIWRVVKVSHFVQQTSSIGEMSTKTTHMTDSKKIADLINTDWAGQPVLCYDGHVISFCDLDRSSANSFEPHQAFVSCYSGRITAPSVMLAFRNFNPNNIR